MKNSIDKSNFFKKYDLIVYLTLLVVTVMLFAGAFYLKPKGAQVYIVSQGEVIAVLPLNQNQSYDVVNSSGQKNTVKISGGKAYVINATCDDKICQKSGKIFRKGESIICQPNKLKVEVK